MARARTILSLPAILCLLLVSCDTTSQSGAATSTNSAAHSLIRPNEAISLAKEAAANLQSPPRIYYEGRIPGSTQAWSDKAGSKTDKYNGCPSVCPLPMTTTTTVNPSNSDGGQDVTFLIQWQSTSGQELSHSWVFHVSDDAQVDFVREDGDELPHVPGDVNPLPASLTYYERSSDMAGARATSSLLAALCLALVLASCGDNASQCLTPVFNSTTNLPLLGTAEAIKLAKQEASKLPSSPRIFDICMTDRNHSCPDVFSVWPDGLGTKVSSCTVGYDIQNSTCYPTVATYTISLASDQQNRGQYITFSSEW